MAGTREGGKRAAEMNKKRYGEDFYKNIGRLGGKNGHTGGFASDPNLAARAGAKGGSKSSRAIPRYITIEGKKIQFDTVQAATKYIASKFGIASYQYVDGDKTIKTSDGKVITILRDPERIY